MPELYAYTDESGNTGMNLFDGKQPWFWTVTLVAPKDIELPAEAAVARWAADLAVPDLHANEVGLRRLDEIAWPIHAFLAEHNCRFILTRLEKRHHASLKYVDTVLDSGINPAIPGYFYAFRPLRLGLAYAIVSNFSPRNQEEWWDVFQRGDLDGFCRITRRVRINVDCKVKDHRLRELAMDALGWALEHPDSFPELTLKRGPHDSPNFVEFTVVVQLLHGIARDYGMDHVQIKRFVQPWHPPPKVAGRRVVDP